MPRLCRKLTAHLCSSLSNGSGLAARSLLSPFLCSRSPRGILSLDLVFCAQRFGRFRHRQDRRHHLRHLRHLPDHRVHRHRCLAHRPSHACRRHPRCRRCCPSSTPRRPDRLQRCCPDRLQRCCPDRLQRCRLKRPHRLRHRHCKACRSASQQPRGMVKLAHVIVHHHCPTPAWSRRTLLCSSASLTTAPQCALVSPVKGRLAAVRRLRSHCSTEARRSGSGRAWTLYVPAMQKR